METKMRVELLTETGDALILNAARASFNRQYQDFTYDQNKRLVKFLAKADPAHFVPFTHDRFTVECDPSHIKWDLLSQENFAGIESTKKKNLVHITNSLWGWKELIQENKVSSILTAHLSNYFASRADLRMAAEVLGFSYHDVPKEYVSIFRDPTISLRITCPIIVARQLVKTSVGVSISEASGRYILYSSTFNPTTWLSAPENRKQGSGAPLRNLKQIVATGVLKASYLLSYAAYKTLLKVGVAPEQARLVCPLGTNTTFVMTATDTAWKRFLNLRLDADAQTEIRELAVLIKQKISNQLEQNEAERRMDNVL